MSQVGVKTNAKLLTSLRLNFSFLYVFYLFKYERVEGTLMPSLPSGFLDSIVRCCKLGHLQKKFNFCSLILQE
jgi:hypothetical protein